MKRKVIIGLIALLLSIDVYAGGGQSSGGGSFGINDDIVEKFPTKKITNTKNQIPGLQNGESLYINAQVVVRTRNYLWLPMWEDGYAEIKITKKNGTLFNVNRLSIMQVQKHQQNFMQMVHNIGVGYDYDVSFNYDYGIINNQNVSAIYAWVSVGVGNGRPINNIGYIQNAYTLPNYYTAVRGTYKSNANSLRFAMKDPSAPVVAFFNTKINDKLGYAFSITNKWGDGETYSVPRFTVSF